MRLRCAVFTVASLFVASIAATSAYAATVAPQSYTVQLLRHGTSEAQWQLTPAAGAEAPFAATRKVPFVGTQTETLVAHKDSSGRVTSVSTVVNSTPADVTVGTTGTLEPVPHQPDLVVVDATVTKLERLRTFHAGGLELQVPITQQHVLKQVVTLKNGTGTLELPDDYVLRITVATGAVPG